MENIMEDIILDLIDNSNEMSRGDLQSVVSVAVKKIIKIVKDNN